MANSSILFQQPWINVNTPVAVNLWTKTIAQAFAKADISPTIQYLSSRSFRKTTVNGVTFLSLPVLQSWMIGVPKLRNITINLIQNRFIKQNGNKYRYIAPLGGPYLLADEVRKVRTVKQTGALYLHPILEHPRVRLQFKDEESLSSYISDVTNLYDILMPITTYLQSLFIAHGRLKPTLLNPIVVNISNKIRKKRVDIEGRVNLLYCGNLEHEEEMLILLNSFQIVNRKLPFTRLIVVGGGTTNRHTTRLIRKYRRVVLHHNIEQSVCFTGRLSHNEVQVKYLEASAFLLPRPFRDYSLAGFPSKLGEYLATSKPVICTGTGDIPLYLKDNFSAYLVMDHSPENFAKAVIKALNDSKADLVGRRGFDIARENFSVEATANRLRIFFGEQNVF